jgi:ATP-dependent DNA helicase DinG
MKASVVAMCRASIRLVTLWCDSFCRALVNGRLAGMVNMSIEQGTVLDGLSPQDLGLGFSEYRPAQLEAIEEALFGDTPIVGLGLPPGAGKSLIAVSIALLGAGRTAILTSTRGLQDQYQRDFHAVAVDIRGMANFACPRARSCEDGRAMGCPCGFEGSYKEAFEMAIEAPIVVTNYAYWMKIRGGLRPFDTLICDEAVEAPKELSRALRISLTEQDLNRMRILDYPPKHNKVESWLKWAGGLLPIIRGEISELERRVLTPSGRDRLRRYIRLEEQLRRFPDRDRDRWVFEYREGTPRGRQWIWDVLDVRDFNYMLVRDIPKVILMSATLKKRTLQELGLQGQFREWDRIFPKEASPIYLSAPRLDGKAIRIDRRTTDEGMELWVKHIDRIISGRLDRKGIIHTVSYARQKFLMEHSQHARIMMANTSDPESDTATEIAMKFRRAPAPAILISPSFSLGWDFPKEECEYVIIAKVPFQPQESAWVKAKMKRDPDYLNAQALQQLVQSAMRGMRSKEDRCEVFITDDHLRWLLPRNREFVPRWFRSSVYNVRRIPQPLPKL